MLSFGLRPWRTFPGQSLRAMTQNPRTTTGEPTSLGSRRHNEFETTRGFQQFQVVEKSG
jgi:hypothetical protein